MLGANTSWPLSTARDNFYLFCSHLGWRRQRLTRFTFTVKNSVSLLAAYKITWKILSVHVCADTSVCIHTYTWIYRTVLFMGAVYEAIVNLNMLFIYSKKGCFLYCLPLQDSDLKQYWMPDSQCKECYDCSEKFTTFRRRHHCRLCGQIFCSRCCNQEIPGKFMGYTGGA